MTSPESSRAKRGPDEHELDRQIAASTELAELIAAATAPATAAELTGEDAALAEFLAARAGRSPGRRGRPARRTVLAAGGVLGVVFAGTGVAAAAGALPGPLQGAAHQLFHAPEPASAPSPSGSVGPSPTASRSAPSSSSRSTASASSSPSLSSTPSLTSPGTSGPSSSPSSSIPSGSPSETTTSTGAASGSATSGSSGTAGASGSTSAAGDQQQSPDRLRKLCHAYEAGSASSKPNKLSTPAFRPLVAAAGGPTKVDSYCAGIGSGPSDS